MFALITPITAVAFAASLLLLAVIDIRGGSTRIQILKKAGAVTILTATTMVALETLPILDIIIPYVSPLLIALIFLLLAAASRALLLPKDPTFRKAMSITIRATFSLWVIMVAYLLSTIGDLSSCGSPQHPDGLCMTLTSVSGNIIWGTFGTAFYAVPLWLAMLGGAVLLRAGNLFFKQLRKDARL